MQSGDGITDDFQRFLKSLDPKPQSTLRCFERGDFYTLHDSDALLVAREYLLNVSLVKHYKKGGFCHPYISVKKSNTDFLRFFLLKRQYRIEIYCASTKLGRDNDWVLKVKASPGNLSSLDDLLLDCTNSVESAWLSALNLRYTEDNVVVHLACCDRESRRIICGKFVDSIQLANLETAFVQLESRECLVPGGLLSTTDEGHSKGSNTGDTVVAEHLSLIFERVGVLVTEVKKSDFSANDVTQDLRYLLNRHGKDQSVGAACSNSVIESKGVLTCLGAIIKYLDLKADESNAASFSLEWLNLDNFVRLDSAATRALHLLPGSDDSKSPIYANIAAIR
ncbi:DNA mismatch repair protein MSH2 [Fasciola hepatica]|uniref:DNA mismatch repair protein MSH2 n=1 Tax=Fasciola hepatica TaxID=6192 RepID=A0A4E0QUI5_FASHE|nr:DNA mismatch repair protein MSH2 [Fasciola hepatica]